MVFAILMMLGTDFAMAQNYAVAINGSKPFESEVTLYEGRITFDIYLEDAPGQAHSGGAWVDFRGFTDKISYVSAGRALTDGSEGVTGPWDPAAGLVINEPNGVGTLMIVVGQLDGDGASPDGDGDIIVARVTLESTALGDDTNINLSTIQEFATWGPVPPYDDSVITAATPNPTLVIHQCAVYDSDEDGIANANDNCPNNYNPNQEDTYPPGGNGIGDACDCECDFDCSGGVEASDVTVFLLDFGRSTFSNPCTNADPCNGDVNCDVNVDAFDVGMFLEDFGRSQFNNPCPACEVGNWCLYEGDPFIQEYSDSGCLGMTQGAYNSSAFDECNIEDWALAEVIGDSIFITAYVTYNCCSSIEVELSNDGNNLDVLVQEIFGRACFCNCCFQVDAEIAGLTPNEYNLTICSQTFNGPPICETEAVEVP
jgi:hypothetical protein